jgi:hypothetical protein
MFARGLALVLAVVAAVAAVLAAGCTSPELERETDIAELRVEAFFMYLGSYTMWGDLRPQRDSRAPCVILGEDVRAYVNDVELDVYRGGREELCDETNEADCEDTARCISPGVDLAWPPPIADAAFVLVDHSGSISCRLGDAFAARTMTRVDVDTWSPARGESVTVRVSPASDLSRFVTDVYFAPKGQPLLHAQHTISGDTITFQIPSTLGTGPQMLYVHFDGDEVPDCDVPARAQHQYVIEQPITVQ